ncbi:glucose-6-phosphate isomerase [Enterococcus mundtii]|uniref:glucose-6-phosphate isomerase n=1 Tax=Enterococcus mundtii TaxID=53346 RepID=UPI00188388CD|nr:glucose-6-phosphate isomerase [Enterococcus mundtii]MBE9912316.1 glucose-6-phosphate isomerase [Enterococcus mundtii]
MNQLMKFDYSNVLSFINENEMEFMQSIAKDASKLLRSGKGPGGENIGWLELPKKYNEDEFERIKATAKKIRKQAEILVVVGIGGSYLGSKAVIDFLKHNFSNKVVSEDGDNPQVLFAGNSISSTYLMDLVETLEISDFAVNIISKSGTTTEPAIAFRILRELLIKKYGEEGANERIYVTTDAKEGALKKEADNKQWETFVIPSDIGGRYSVLTAVGLLPIAASGASIDDLMEGAREAMVDLSTDTFEENDGIKYATLRNILYRKGKTIEILANYEPNLVYFSEWWKQLFGESEGKDKKGIYPATAAFSTDLHSIGQTIQDGMRNMFETIITIYHPRKSLSVPSQESDLDGLKYLENREVDYVNRKAFEGTLMAHVEGGVPNFIIEIENMQEKALGYMIYFFEYACGVSSYINGVNPFDQPGVESYKRNMFALLGKPGYENI